MGNDAKNRIPYTAVLVRHFKWVLLAVVVTLFLFLLYPNLIVGQYQYQLGDIAMHDIKSPRDFFIEDTTATAANQEQAAEQVLTVYDHDPRITPQVIERVRTAFDRMRRILDESRAAQTDSAENTSPSATVSAAAPTPAPANRQELERMFAPYKEEFESLIGFEISRGAFRLLSGEAFWPPLAEMIIRIVDTILSNGLVANKEVLLREVDKGILLRDVVSQNETTVYSLKQYYGPDQARTMVRIVAEPLVKDFNYNQVNLVVDFSQRLLQPNITLNLNETEERKKQARAAVKSILYKVKTGEMLLREGERVNAIQLLKLHALEEQNKNKPVFATASGAALIVTILLIIMYLLHIQLPGHTQLNSNKNLLFLALMLIVALAMVKAGAAFSAGQSVTSPLAAPAGTIIFVVPIAACAMIVCLVLGFQAALPFAIVTAVCATILFGGRIETFLFLALISAMAAYWTQHCRERKVVIMAGIKAGLLGALLAVAIAVHASDFGGIGLVWIGTLAFAGGLISGIITLGVVPLAEMAFGYTTDISLLELANLDRPILRRLMIESPGTYHHSVIVGSLVEAAATEINANPLLAKVCGYYHDIGKVKKPLYFIENQTDGRNRHDKLAPSMSSLILIAHVKDGVEIAQKQKLGQVIIDTIQQHHGTSLIHFFFEKAKQLKGEDSVKIEDFRYPGPKPQTREVGLVMLADIVEAASRTLENPTPSRIQGLVQHLINKVFSDGQLDSCELTLKDLHSIAKSFNKILNGIYHHRIEYAEAGAKDNGKVKNGSTDRQPASKSPHRDPVRAKESAGHLKRLGMS
jgi:cyclic-di-AMP phosphodiesterase PgpH